MPLLFAVLATFLMRTMVPLRLVAILSNILFVAIAYLQNIHPVLFLHLTLLPINVWRLLALRQSVDAQLVSTPLARRRMPNI